MDLVGIYNIKEHAEKKIRLKQEIAAIESKNEGILGIIESGKALPILIERLERNLQDIERIKADLDVLIAHPPKEIDAKKFAELVERMRKAISAKNYHELKRFVSLYVSKIIVRNDDITVVVSYAKIVLLVGGADESMGELKKVPFLSELNLFSIFFRGIFSTVRVLFPPLRIKVK